MLLAYNLFKFIIGGIDFREGLTNGFSINTESISFIESGLAETISLL
jgi:hypothetical protein